MTKYIIKAILPALICLTLIGCEEAQKTSETDEALNIAESKYDSYELRKARDEAKIEMLNNLAECEKAEHEIVLDAAQNNIRLVDTNDDVITGADYKAAEYLIKKLSKKIRKRRPLLVASFVNLNDLERASTFGRVISEQISSRFKQLGYTIIDVKLDTATFAKESSGELLISHELSEIGVKYGAPAVVVGSYAAASDRVYITARVVRVDNSKILASYDYNIPITRDVFKLLISGVENPDEPLDLDLDLDL
jgi:TolB-like protein